MTAKSLDAMVVALQNSGAAAEQAAIALRALALRLPPPTRAFHIYGNGHARAFFRPIGWREKFVLFARGWRPHSIGYCWQKANRKQRLADNGSER